MDAEKVRNDPSGSLKHGRMWSFGLDTDSSDDDSILNEETTHRSSTREIGEEPAGLAGAGLEEKFSALKRKREEITQRSSGKRIRALQRQTLKLVSEQIQDSVDREVIEGPDVRLPILPHQKKHSEKQKGSRPGSLHAGDERWHDLGKHMNRTEHLSGLSVQELGGGGDGSTQLEKEMEGSIASGNVQKASELSDKIADRQAAIRVANAVSHRNAEVGKVKVDEERKRRKKNRLHWGFDSKQRWERKGNM